MLRSDDVVAEVRHAGVSVYARLDRGARQVVLSVVGEGCHREYVIAPHPTRLGLVAMYETTERTPGTVGATAAKEQLD